MIVLSIPAHKVKLLTPQLIEEFNIEYRLDLSDNHYSLEQIDPDQKSILTLRFENPSNQDLQRKKDLFISALSKYKCLCDIELDEYEFFRECADSMILSVHLDHFDKVEIDHVIDDFTAKKAKYYKLAVNTDSYEELAYLKKKSDEFKQPLFILSTGTLSHFSRICYRLISSIGTYIGLDEWLTHPQQLSLSQYRKYRVESITQRTLFGGIVGGKQVFKSLGIDYYNSLFETHYLDARYLPFVFTDINEFQILLTTFDMAFYGFSVTMPFKQSFIKNETINTIILRSDNFSFKQDYYNSDQMAFEKIKEELGDLSNKTILLIGSGASAETAIKVFGPNLDLLCRNSEKRQILISKYALNSNDQLLMKYDLMINCTPLGMNGESLRLLIGDIQADYLIDLPYSNLETPIVREFLLDKKGFIDGYSFWKFQAVFQAQSFLQCIDEMKRKKTE